MENSVHNEEDFLIHSEEDFLSTVAQKDMPCEHRGGSQEKATGRAISVSGWVEKDYKTLRRTRESLDFVENRM